ncbi:MAG: polysaccharide biosynthesis/export family protein [candidate division KSB1 bacterium]|jgi:protein involved in polysaccharide export with SLBB domain|nr:polysaccharide biosynthesis/export family protein [candidate division KSB1 bacterium]
MIKRSYIPALIILLSLFDCSIKSTKEDLSEPAVQISEKTSIPGEMSPYRLGFGDVLEIKFLNNSHFNESLVVRPDGRISMQVVGDISVTRMTPEALSDTIATAYSRIIKSPEVTVIVREFGANQVYVLGEVNSPGAFPLQRELSVIQSLALAGGQKESANLKSVLLLRKKRDGSMDVKRLDLSLKSFESSQSNDDHIQAYDIVYVPKTFIANVNTFVDQALSGLIQPLDVYLRAVWYYQR